MYYKIYFRIINILLLDIIFVGTQNVSSRNVPAMQLQRNDRLLNKEFKFTLLSKKCVSKPFTSTTGKKL